MRLLTIVVAVLALIYSGYWFVGATAAERGARGALDDLATQGWDVQYADLSTHGYPSRFDTTLTDAHLTSPKGTVINLPFAQALALSYQPNRVIAIFPPEMSISTDGQNVMLKSEGLRASASVAATPSFPLDAITAEVGAASVIAPLGTTTLEKGLVALRDDPVIDNAYDAYLNLQSVAFPDALKLLLDPESQFPLAMDHATLDVTVTLDRPLDRHAAATFETDPPRVLAIDVNNVSLVWGAMQLTAKGNITVGADGYPVGEVMITAQDWASMVTMAVNSGALQPGLAQLVNGMGENLSAGSDTLTLPLTYDAGRASLGPIPLGPAPKFF